MGSCLSRCLSDASSSRNQQKPFNATKSFAILPKGRALELICNQTFEEHGISSPSPTHAVAKISRSRLADAYTVADSHDEIMTSPDDQSFSEEAKPLPHNASTETFPSGIGGRVQIAELPDHVSRSSTDPAAETGAVTESGSRELPVFVVEAKQLVSSLHDGVPKETISNDTNTSDQPLPTVQPVDASAHVGAVTTSARRELPLLVVEAILQLSPELHTLDAFLIRSDELEEDSKTVVPKKQLGAIKIKHSNQLRLLGRLAFDYVRRKKCSKLLCRLSFTMGDFNFAKAKVQLAYLHSDAVSLLDNTRANSKFNGPPDLSTSYYLDHLAHVELLTFLPVGVEFGSELIGWFSAMWEYVHNALGTTLPTDIRLSIGETAEPSVAPPAICESSANIPNNFQRLDFSGFRSFKESVDDLCEPLLDLFRHIMIAGSATIRYVGGPLPYILALQHQPAGAFASIKHVAAIFDESLDFSGAEHPNPLTTLASSYPNTEVLQLHSTVAKDGTPVRMDLSPLRQMANLREFNMAGRDLDWPNNFAVDFVTPPAKWDILHPNVRSIRMKAEALNLDGEVPVIPEDVGSFRQLLQFAAQNCVNLDVRNFFTVKQWLLVLDAVKDKLSCVEKLSLEVDGIDDEDDVPAFLDELLRLFALIERSMPRLSSLVFRSFLSTVDLPCGPAEVADFAYDPELFALLRLLKGRPKQVKDLILHNCLDARVFAGDNDAPYNHFQEVLMDLMRCLIETDLVCLTIWLDTCLGGPDVPKWPLQFCNNLADDPNDLKDRFNSEATADHTKGRQLVSVKLYFRVLDEDDEFPLDSRGNVLEIRCVLRNPASNEHQNLNLFLISDPNDHA